MIHTIRRRPQARRDIIEIYKYVFERNPAAADALIEAIESTIQGLARFPGVGNVWKSAEPKLKGIRYTTVSGYRNYLIFFKYSQGIVRIYRLVHGARDLRHLFG